MRFFKNNFKLIIGFVIGVILASGITVYAYSYIANDVMYTKKDGTEISVENALNELYINNNVKQYDMLNKTTTSNSGYELKKVLLRNDEENKLLYFKFEADTLNQDAHPTYTIDISNFSINSILDYKIYTYNRTGNFTVCDCYLQNNRIIINCDSNSGSGTKYDYDYMAVFIYK